MDTKELIQFMIADYKKSLPLYRKMRKYYDGQHDIYNKGVFKIRKGTSDRPTHINWISKFIGEEISYGLNQPVTYSSKSDNKSIVNDVLMAMEHFKLNHDQKLMRELEIYGRCYCLYFFDSKGRFCEMILNPTNAIAYCDEEGNVLLFIRFYEKKYCKDKFYNVYYPDGSVEIYRNNVLEATENTNFGCMPVSVCEIEHSETIYAKIKELNDDYNELISNQQSLISEFKNAYLCVCDDKQQMKETNAIVEALKDDAGIIIYPNANGKPSWLIKEINDTAIKNQLDEIKENLYAQSGHIDFNEKLSSNLSGVALQSRLTGLDQRVNFVLNAVVDALYDRIYMICRMLEIKKNKTYDPTDVRITANIDIPMDTAARVNEAVQLSGIVSHKTRIERLGFVENAETELARLREENANNSRFSLQQQKSAEEEAFYGGVSTNE